MSDPQPREEPDGGNGNAVTMVAGLAATEAYGPSEVARIDALGDRLRAGFAAQLAARGVGGPATGYGSFVNVHFTPEPVRDYRSAARGSLSLRRLVHLGLLNEGVFCAPRLMCCTSTAMGETVVDEVVSRFGRVLERVKAAVRGSWLVVRGSGLVVRSWWIAARG